MDVTIIAECRPLVCCRLPQAATGKQNCAQYQDLVFHNRESGILPELLPVNIDSLDIIIHACIAVASIAMVATDSCIPLCIMVEAALGTKAASPVCLVFAFQHLYPAYDVLLRSSKADCIKIACAFSG